MSQYFKHSCCNTTGFRNIRTTGERRQWLNAKYIEYAYSIKINNLRSKRSFKRLPDAFDDIGVSNYSTSWKTRYKKKRQFQ